MSLQSGISRKLRFAAALLLAAILLVSLSACAKETRTPRGATAVTTEVLAEVAALDRLAEEAEQLTQSGKIAEARIRLNTLGEKMVAANFRGITGVEGVRSLSDAILAAQRSFNRARFSEADALAALARVRLITDAMLHPDNPLWHRSYKLLKDDAARMEAAAAQGDTAGLRSAYGDFKKRFQDIHPALTVKIPPERIEKLDSLAVFLNEHISAGRTEDSAVLEAVKQVDQSIDELFGRREDSTAYLPLAQTERPLLWTFGIGTLLTAVLSFVGWRMFHSDKSYARVRRDQLRKRS